jgi:hypothetical protein
MLSAMEIPAAALPGQDAATVPAIALGVVMGILLVAAAGLLALLVRRRRRAAGEEAPGPSAGREPGFGEDDLPGFLESPPGMPGAPGAPTAPDGPWPALAGAAPPPPSGTTAPDAAGGRGIRTTLTAMAAAALLLIGAAAAIAVVSRDRAPAPGATGSTAGSPTTAVPSPAGPGGDGVELHLAFAGVVLERHAVGVTATYPTVHLTSDGERSLAAVELPTFHCLSSEAPRDPLAAGCTRSVTEHAELTGPALEATVRDGAVRLSGRFPTFVQSPGAPREWTGRAYELTVTAAPTAGRARDGWQPAAGRLRWGTERSESTGDPAVNRLRAGS